MRGVSDPKLPADVLRTYLGRAREGILWKLDGLGERAVRLPRTPTGTSLLGIVLHCANVEIGYFGATFGREWPEPDHPLLVTDEQADADPQADWWVPAEVSAAEVADFYRAVWGFSDATIADLDLDARGAVPWWPEDHRDVSLARVIVHVISDTTRHGGHADILREAIDGAAGLQPESTNLPALGNKIEGFVGINRYIPVLEGPLNTPAHKKFFDEAVARLKQVDPSGPLPDRYVQSNFEAMNFVKLGIQKSGFKDREDTMKLIEVLEGMEVKAGDDFPQGDKTLRKDDHQAFVSEFIFEIKGGKHRIVEVVPKEKTIFPPACKFA